MTVYSETDLERFRHIQRTAYDCVVDVEAELRPGMTEREVARMMRDWLSDRGVTEYFHVPFVWFGDRTAFRGFRRAFQFFPTRRRLEPGMAVILDVAPARDGYAADIGYSCSLGYNGRVRALQRDLEAYRTLIPELVKKRATARAVYEEVDRLVQRQGYDNRHQVYPQRVLAHKVFRMQPGWLERIELGGFGIRALRTLGRSAAQARRGVAHVWPFWNDEKASDIPIEPGLWAVEPHLGFDDVGAKWEELLVVTPDDAYWLDDDLPHVRRWRDSTPSLPSGASF